MPEGDAGEAGDGSEAGNESEKQTSRTWDRATICVSSQVGCAVDCRFCFTGLLGVKRNLTAGEIVGQVLALAAEQHIPRRSRLSVVFMGMGEPLLNYAPVINAVQILADSAGAALALRRITVSTSGII